jgi:hypothetical protein
MPVLHPSTQELAMPASEPGSEAQRSRFGPRCAKPRWLICGLLALAGCLNPVPDTDPSARDSVSVVDRPDGETPGRTDPAGGGAFNGEQLTPEGPASPAINPPTSSGSVADAGAPALADAGADARAEDAQGQDEP